MRRDSAPKGSTTPVTARRREGEVEVIIDDQGQGITAEKVERIFERFYTTDGDREGTGLGLAIVRAVAESHGGTVTVEARVGGGARFVLTLPRRA